MKLEALQANLATEQQAWNETVLLPNTLERNVRLAAQRKEIGRIEKLILTQKK